MTPADRRRLRHMIREGKELSVIALALGCTVEQIKTAISKDGI